LLLHRNAPDDRANLWDNRNDPQASQPILPATPDLRGIPVLRAATAHPGMSALLAATVLRATYALPAIPGLLAIPDHPVISVPLVALVLPVVPDLRAAPVPQATGHPSITARQAGVHIAPPIPGLLIPGADAIFILIIAITLTHTSLICSGPPGIRLGSSLAL
jgi:hypothetical protein